MTIETRTYYGVPGAILLSDPSLINVKVVRVKRAGTGYNSSGLNDPGNREFQYTPSNGRIRFLDEFIGQPGISSGSVFDPPTHPEKVMVRIKY